MRGAVILVVAVGLAAAQVYDPNMPSLNGTGNSTPPPAAPKTQPKASDKAQTDKKKTDKTPADTKKATEPTRQMLPGLAPIGSAPKPVPAKAPEPAKPADPLSGVFNSQRLGSTPAPAPAPAAPAPAPLPGVGNAVAIVGSVSVTNPNLGFPSRNPIAVHQASDGQFVIAQLLPSNPLRPGKGISSRMDRLILRNFSLKELMEYAWVIHAKQIEGGAEWTADEPFDLVAALPNPRPRPDQMRRMSQAVVTSKFSLKFHTEKREMPVYVLKVAEGGPKMKARTPEEAKTAGSAIGLPFAPRIPAKNASVPRLAALLQDSVLDRPVVDQTGLTGTYDFDLKWQADKTQFGGKGSEGAWHGDPKDPDLFAAIQSQLGLKLEAVNMAVEVYKIDDAIRPIMTSRPRIR